MAEAVHDGGAAGPAIPASAETLLRFQPETPTDGDEQPELAVYLLAAPTQKLYRAYRAGLLARNLRHPGDDEIESEIRVWLDDLRLADPPLSPELFDRRMRDMERFHDLKSDLEKDAKRKLAERVAANAGDKGGAETVEDTPTPLERDQQLIVDRYQQLRRVARESCPGVQDMEQKRAQFLSEYPKVAAAVALRGGERLPFPVVVRGTEADAATMANIDDDTQHQLGLYWLGQFALTIVQKKTSDSSPPSPTTPTTTPLNGDVPPSSTASAKGSRRSRATTTGTKQLTSTPAG